MQTVTEHIKKSLLDNSKKLLKTDPKKTLSSLRETQWSPVFEKYMRNRLVMGALRYGMLHEKGKPTYDRANAILKRWTVYHRTGNKEMLVDIANLCLLEFEEGAGFFQSTENTEKVKCLKKQ